MITCSESDSKSVHSVDVDTETVKDYSAAMRDCAKTIMKKGTSLNADMLQSIDVKNDT